MLLSLPVDEDEEDERDEGATEDDVMGADEDVIGTDDLREDATELGGATELEDGADDEPVPPLRLPYTSNSHSE